MMVVDVDVLAANRVDGEGRELYREEGVFCSCPPPPMYTHTLVVRMCRGGGGGGGGRVVLVAVSR